MVHISHFIHFKVLFTFVQFQNVLLHWFLKLQVNFSEVLKDYRRRYIIHVLVIVIDLHFTGFIIKKYIKLKQLIMTHWKKSAKKKILWRIAMVKTSLIQSILDFSSQNRNWSFKTQKKKSTGPKIQYQYLGSNYVTIYPYSTIFNFTIRQFPDRVSVISMSIIISLRPWTLKLSKWVSLSGHEIWGYVRRFIIVCGVLEFEKKKI